MKLDQRWLRVRAVLKFLTCKVGKLKFNGHAKRRRDDRTDDG